MSIVSSTCCVHGFPLFFAEGHACVLISDLSVVLFRWRGFPKPLLRETWIVSNACTNYRLSYKGSTR